MNPKNTRERQIYLSRLSPSQRAKIKKAAAEKKEPIKEETATERWKRITERLVYEGIDVGRAITWLNQAQEIITKRSEDITAMDQKEGYLQLATAIQAAIPVNNATPESVASNLNILRQQIQLKDDDSTQLRALKVHLVTKISEVLNNPQEGTPEAGAAGEEGAPGAEGAAPPPDMGTPPPGPATPPGQGTPPPPR